MSDPIRLLDDPSFRGSLSNGRDARALLELGRDMAPPADAQARGWDGLQSVIGGAAAGAALATPKTASAAPVEAPLASGSQGMAPAATKTGAALGTKLGVVGGVIGAALIAITFTRAPDSRLSDTQAGPSFSAEGGAASMGGDPHAPRGFTSIMASSAPVAPKETRAKEAETVAPTPPEPTEVAVVDAPQASTPRSTANAEPAIQVDRGSQLKLESAAVQEARSQLAAGNPSGALKTLSQLDVDVPRGILGQERTVLTIEALKKSGQGAAAAQRAAAFIEANPKSPYADRLRAYLQ